MNLFTLKNNLSSNTYGEISNFEIKEKKSKFIAYVFNISCKEEAEEYIDIIRKDNKEARHVVYIYSYVENEMPKIKFSDDGEPQGTGTKMIYEYITKENLSNICIVIVRYFGGILLGAGPLARAYSNTVKEAILACEKVPVRNYIDYTFDMIYNNYEIIKHKLEGYINEELVIIKDVIFENDICVNLLIDKEALSEVENIIKDYIK